MKQKPPPGKGGGSVFDASTPYNQSTVAVLLGHDSFQSTSHSDLTISPPPPDDVDCEDGDGDGEPVRWITVATYWKPTDAHMARIRLESEEIDVVMLDETLVTTDWFLANAVGGIKLQVPQPDAAIARALLEQSRVGIEARIAAADGEPLSDGLDLCPRCKSDAIYPARLSRRLTFLAILLLGLPLPMLLRRRMRCAGCGFEWR